MKCRFPCCLLAFLLSLLDFLPTYAQDGLPVYSIHLGSFDQPAKADFSPLSTFGFVYADPGVNGYKNVFLGGYRREETARNLVAQLGKKGYANAFVTSCDPKQGLEVTVIQLASVHAGDPVDWRAFSLAGPLFVLPDEQQVKIMTGILADLPTARAQLPKIREMGFHDAFVRVVNNVLLRPVTEFESGIPLQRALIPLGPDLASSNLTPPPADADPANPGGLTAKGEISQPDKNLSFSPVFSALAPAKPASIRQDLKRTAALELQRTLRSAGVYTAEPDGLFNPATQIALTKLQQSHPVLSRPVTRMPAGRLSPDPNLQQAIDRLGSDPLPPRDALSELDAPIALAYQAYALFLENGPHPDVDALMAKAAGPTAAHNPDIDQLIHHIVSLHAQSADNAPNLPCWLFSRHPGPTLAALRSLNPQQSAGMTPCGGFWEWEEVVRLTHITREICAEPTCARPPTQLQLMTLASLFVNPSPPSDDSGKLVERWNSSLWQNVGAWADRDPLLGSYATALRTAFFSTELLLEDFFLREGFSNLQAKLLALQVLHALTADHLRRFVG